MTIESDFQDIAGMRVAVYYNVHRKLFSIKALEGKSKGRVVAHIGDLALRDASFKVSEAGRERVLREGIKNVHAYIVGILAYPNGTASKGNRVEYNPFKFSSFVWSKSRDAVHSAKWVQCETNGQNRPEIYARVTP
jgi:hypothetical protein